jgi:hypothetical protein
VHVCGQMRRRDPQHERGRKRDAPVVVQAHVQQAVSLQRGSADRIIVPSESTRQDLERYYGITSEKVDDRGAGCRRSLSPDRRRCRQARHTHSLSRRGPSVHRVRWKAVRRAGTFRSSSRRSRSRSAARSCPMHSSWLGPITLASRSTISSRVTR